tara:strand:+ start:5507 stop:5773 length:267 start_codon:yes stop_codon:yes gene_type:complete
MATGREIIDNYHDKLEVIKEDIEKDSEKILKAINIDELLKDPAQYLTKLGKQYYESHTDNLKKAIKIGEVEADRMIKKYVKADKKRNI